MRVESFAQVEDTQERLARPQRSPRVASERSDIDYLLRALGNLCELVNNDVLGPPGAGLGLAKEYPYLRGAIWTARLAAFRVTKNRTERDARAKRKRRRAA